MYRIDARADRIVSTPYSMVTHFESATRGAGDTYPPADRRLLFESRWRDLLAQGDPYDNPHLATGGRRPGVAAGGSGAGRHVP